MKHESTRIYTTSIELNRVSAAVVERLPPGDGFLADQLRDVRTGGVLWSATAPAATVARFDLDGTLLGVDVYSPPSGNVVGLATEDGVGFAWVGDAWESDVLALYEGDNPEPIFSSVLVPCLWGSGSPRPEVVIVQACWAGSTGEHDPVPLASLVPGSPLDVVSASVIAAPRGAALP